MALLMDGGSTLTRASMPERLIILCSTTNHFDRLARLRDRVLNFVDQFWRCCYWSVVVIPTYYSDSFTMSMHSIRSILLASI
jgi:hypothetical protein